MAYKINFESYSSNFSLPSGIVGEDFASVDPDYLKVILLIYKNSDKNYSANLLSNLLNQSEEKVEEAISYWIKKGYLLEQTNASVPQNVIAVSRHTPVVPAAPSPNSELSFLLECMENLLKRPVTSVEYKSVIHIMEYVKLPADVILMAIDYCVSVNKMNARYLEKVCASWADNGITTHEQAEQYLSFLKASRQNESAVKKLFGIQDRNLIESEKEHIARWFCEYQFDTDIIGYAYEKTISAIGKLSFPYINKILSSWYEKGYGGLDEIQENEGNGRRKRTGSSSYDIDELDRYWDNVPKLN